MPRGIPNVKREDMKRKPAGMPRKKLGVTGLDSDKRQYWAKEHQFPELLDAGYEFVLNQGDVETGDDAKTHAGSRVSVPAGRNTDERLYLMQIRKDWYAENQEIKQDAIDQQEREMFNRGETKTSYQVQGTRKEGHAKF